MLTAGMVTGAAIASGALLIVVGSLTRPPPLAEALAQLVRGVPSASASTEPGGVRTRSMIRLARVVTRGDGRSSASESDLRVVGRTDEQHIVDKFTAAVAGLALPPALAVIMVLGDVPVPLPLVALATGGLAIAGFFLPDARLRRQAATRRRGFRYALSSYLDLVNVILAAGAGVETALADAADAGQGWAFVQLRAALARARFAGESPWRAFHRLGEDLDLPELREAASGLALAGTHGARIRASLQARAGAMRIRDLAEMEGEAEAATERMSVPSVVLVVGFIVFVGYPAAYEIVGF